MRFSELSPEVLAEIGRIRYDSFFEKHEGPWKWESDFRYGSLEFLRIRDQFDVLLPIDAEQHPNITVLRCHASNDEACLTLFLKDTTCCTDPKYERFEAGRVAICDRFPGASFYVAIFYHEWFITI